MNIEELMSGATAYTSLAEVAAFAPDTEAPEATPTGIIVLTVYMEC